MSYMLPDGMLEKLCQTSGSGWGSAALRRSPPSARRIAAGQKAAGVASERRRSEGRNRIGSSRDI